jgi:hypothetical protein
VSTRTSVSGAVSRTVEGSTETRGNGVVFAAGSALITLGLLGYYRLVWGSFGNFLTGIDVWGEPFADFQRYYYPMGKAILEGAAPVDGFVYSPFAALLMAPFALLPQPAAVMLWGMLQVAAIIVYLWLFRRLVPAPLRLQWLFVALALSSFPLLHTFKFGQITILAALALLFAFLAAGNGARPAAAGLLAFAVSFKWHPAIFMAPFAARRDLRILLWAGAAGFALLLAIPVLLLGVPRLVQFYGALRAVYADFDWVLTSYNTQYFPNVIMRVVEAAGLRIHPLLAASVLTGLRVLAWLVVATNLVLVFLVQRARLLHADLWSFHILFLNVPFLLGTSWPVDLVFLPFAQTLLVWAVSDHNAYEAPQHGSSSEQRRGGRARLALLLALASMVLSNVILFNLIGDRTLYGTLGLVFWADLLALVATYLLLLPAARRALRVDGEAQNTG